MPLYAATAYMGGRQGRAAMATGQVQDRWQSQWACSSSAVLRVSLLTATPEQPSARTCTSSVKHMGSTMPCHRLMSSEGTQPTTRRRRLRAKKSSCWQYHSHVNRSLKGRGTGDRASSVR